MTQSWMAKLATHYQETRRKYSHEQLIIIFDIDGTILDMRHMIHSRLRDYDAAHQTNFFQDLTIWEITVHENNIAPLLADLEITPPDQHHILAWFNENAWTSEAMLEAHRPFSGVLEAIRWFQMQPNTHVGLNTARTEVERSDTLQSLNQLGEEFKVTFSNDQLYLKPNDWPSDTPSAKIAGIRWFEAQGYHVFAFIDNEPENVQAIAEIDPRHEILLLHADTIFQSKRAKLSPRIIGGKAYDLTDLISKDSLPQHTQFVWQGINDITNLGQFLRSDVHWGAFDVTTDLMAVNTVYGPNIVKHETVSNYRPWLTTLDDALARTWGRNKGIKLNLNVNGTLLDQVLKRVDAYCFSESNLWFSSQIEVQGAEGFRYLAQSYPQATIECAIDHLVPLIDRAPDRAQKLLDRFQRWGINRLAVSWQMHNLPQLIDQLDRWGFEINIYDVPDLEGFLRAILLTPQSITSDFHFPKWAYYGHGSEHNKLEVTTLMESTLQMTG